MRNSSSVDQTHILYPFIKYETLTTATKSNMQANRSVGFKGLINRFQNLNALRLKHKLIKLWAHENSCSTHPNNTMTMFCNYSSILLDVNTTLVFATKNKHFYHSNGRQINNRYMSMLHWQFVTVKMLQKIRNIRLHRHHTKWKLRKKHNL